MQSNKVRISRVEAHIMLKPKLPDHRLATPHNCDRDENGQKNLTVES